MSLAIAGATILILAPHTDDGELGAGGSISRWIREGNNVHYVAFSACESNQPPDRPATVLRDECAKATQNLGIPQQNLAILDFEVRQFSRDRQKVLDATIDLERSLKPDIVLIPSPDDIHQDHHLLAAESLRAFKRTRILGYELPWNNFRFNASGFVALHEEDCERKWQSLLLYESQSDRPYMSRDFVMAQMRYRGAQSGLRIAEAFQILRWYF